MFRYNFYKQQEILLAPLLNMCLYTYICKEKLLKSFILNISKPFWSAFVMFIYNLSIKRA